MSKQLVNTVLRKELLVIAVVVGLITISVTLVSAGKGSPDLEGVQWTLVSISADKVPEGVKITALFDEGRYDEVGWSLASGQGFRLEGELTAYAPPGYPAFLALIYAIFGHNLAAARLAQCLAGAGAALIWLYSAWTIPTSSILSRRKVTTIDSTTSTYRSPSPTSSWTR